MTNELLEQPLQPPVNPEDNAEAIVGARTVIDQQGYERRVYDITPSLSIS